MADVVTRAGTSRALLYRHFSNRDELIAGVLTRTTDRYLDHIRAALGDGGPFGPTLVEGMALIVEMARADQLMGLVFRGEGEAIASGVVSSSDALRDRSAAFAAEVFAGMDEDDLAQINPDLELSEVIDHCMLVGLGLIRGFDHIATDPKLLRRHLETFLLPGILR
jgi:AcrR family transcriptional regulator